MSQAARLVGRVASRAPHSHAVPLLALGLPAVGVELAGAAADRAAASAASAASAVVGEPSRCSQRLLGDVEALRATSARARGARAGTSCPRA